jgi:hypothetical protein
MKGNIFKTKEIVVERLKLHCHASLVLIMMRGTLFWNSSSVVVDS